mgnify:CR=1 FL=1
MKKQIDLFGNEISMEHATEKPVIKETKNQQKTLYNQLLLTQSVRRAKT